MSRMEHPVYLIALRDQWLVRCEEGNPAGFLSYASEDDARTEIGIEAERLRLPTSLFRIVVYEFTGRVLEG
jgi:hypothetical protein